MTTSTADYLRQAIPSVLVAVVVGMASSYLTVQATIAVLDQRTTELEIKVRDLQESARADREALIRLEAKIDLLLQGRGGR